jgi:hypothetical protein
MTRREANDFRRRDRRANTTRLNPSRQPPKCAESHIPSICSFARGCQPQPWVCQRAPSAGQTRAWPLSEGSSGVHLLTKWIRFVMEPLSHHGDTEGTENEVQPCAQRRAHLSLAPATAAHSRFPIHTSSFSLHTWRAGRAVRVDASQSSRGTRAYSIIQHVARRVSVVGATVR